MKHLGTTVLETDRLTLREFEISDALCVFNNWRNDEVVEQFMDWRADKSPQDTEKKVAEWVAEYEKDNYYNWAIILKDTGEPIGAIGGEVNELLQSIDVGYCIGQKWWGQGIASEAFKAVISYLFEQVGVNRIVAMHAPENPSSAKVMKKCGLVYEGTLRQGGYSHNGIIDCIVYSIIASDYFA